MLGFPLWKVLASKIKSDFFVLNAFTAEYGGQKFLEAQP